MKVYKIKDLVKIVVERSPFYRNLYKDISLSKYKLSDLPIVNEESFWQANSFQQKNNEVLTESLVHGILVRASGVTGPEKTSVFSAKELRVFSKIMAEKLCQTHLLEKGDRIANLFMSGYLYGGFLFMNKVLLESSEFVLELPIGAHPTDINLIKNSIEIFKKFNVNVVMSTPHLLTLIAAQLKKEPVDLNIRSLLYGSDLLLESQFQFLKDVFPEASISSSGYASTDCGFLGYADRSCEINEYRTDDKFTIIEIVDEQGQLIEEPFKIGRLIVTNLTKILMPIIRYPVGDQAMWVEPKSSSHRKLKLMGRGDAKKDLIILGGKEVSYIDFYYILKKTSLFSKILSFQIIVIDENNLILRLAMFINQKDEVSKNIKEIASLLKNYLLDLYSLPSDSYHIDIEVVDIFDFNISFSKVKRIIRRY